MRFLCSPRTLAHRVRRFDNDGTESNSVSVVNAGEVHGGSEESGGAMGLDVGRNLLEMPPRRLFALIDAKEDLGGRTRCRRAWEDGARGSSQWLRARRVSWRFRTPRCRIRRRSRSSKDRISSTRRCRKIGSERVISVLRVQVFGTRRKAAACARRCAAEEPRHWRQTAALIEYTDSSDTGDSYGLNRQANAR